MFSSAPVSNDPDQPFDTPAAARQIGCSPGYLKKLRQTGGGPRFDRLGTRKGIVYRRRDIEEWRATRRFGSTTDYPEAAR